MHARSWVSVNNHIRGWTLLSASVVPGMGGGRSGGARLLPPRPVSLRSEPGDWAGLSWGWGCPVQAGEFSQTWGSSCPSEPRPLFASPLRAQGGFWNQRDSQLPLPKSPSWTKRHQLVLGSKKECKQLCHRSRLSLPCESRIFCSLDLTSARWRFPGNAWERELASGAESSLWRAWGDVRGFRSSAHGAQQHCTS